MSTDAQPFAIRVERWHAEAGKVAFDVLSTDSELEIQRKCAVAIAQAGRVVKYTGGFYPQMPKADKKAEKSRLDVDVIQQRLYFSIAWIPSPEDSKKPNIEAVRRVVGIIFEGTANRPTYEKETYRNWIPLTHEDAVLVLRNIVTAPLDIPPTDTGEVVKWFFGGEPATPQPRQKKSETPPAEAPAPQPPSEPLDMDKVYVAAWEMLRLVPQQVDSITARLQSQGKPLAKSTVWNACKEYASGEFNDMEELIAWANIAFEHTINLGVAWSAFAYEHFENEIGAHPRIEICRAFEKAVDDMRERL